MNCPACKRPNPADAVNCENCGEELLPARESPKRETKAEDELFRPAGGVKRRTIVEDGAQGAGAMPAGAPVPALRPNDPFYASILPAGVPAAQAARPAPPQPGMPPKRSTVIETPGGNDVFFVATQAAGGVEPAPQRAVSGTGRRVIGWLITFNGQPDGLSFVLREGKNTIGRDADRDIQLDHHAVSKVHACLQFRGGRTWIFDDKSENGTHLNGTDIFQDQPGVKENDVLRIGPYSFLIKLIDPVKYAEVWGPKATL